MELLLDPDGGLVCGPDGLSVVRDRKPQLLCDDAAQYPDEYADCEANVYLNDDCQIWAHPSPCAVSLCATISGVEGVEANGTVVYDGEIVLPAVDSPYPVNWMLGISRTVQLSVTDGLAANLDVSEAINGLGVRCAYRCSTYNADFRESHHVTYPYCFTSPNTGAVLPIQTRILRGPGVNSADHLWRIDGVGISARQCDC